MNTRRAALLILIVTLLGLHTVYTRQEELDYSLRTGQLYAAADHLAEEKLELEVNLSTIRQPVSAARLASKYCPDLGPAHPELAAYQLAQDVPHMVVPSLRRRQAEEAARNSQPAADPTAPQVLPMEQARARQSFDSPDLSDLPAATSGAVSVGDAPAPAPAVPMPAAQGNSPLTAAAAAVGAAAIRSVPLPTANPTSAQSAAVPPPPAGAVPAPRAARSAPLNAFIAPPVSSGPTVPLSPAAVLAPAPAAATAPAVPAAVPVLGPAEPPVDTDDPDATDAPQPVEWPEEPANNEPVFGCLPPALMPAVSREARHG